MSTRRLPLVLLPLLATLSVSAATLTWDAGAGDLLWGSDTNWNPDQLPADGDDLVFDLGGVDTGGANAVTSILNLTNPAPFSVRNLFLNPPAATGTHHLNLSGNTLRLTGELRAGYGTSSSLATVSNGTLELGASTGSRSGNVAIGYRGAGAVGGAVAGELRLTGGAPLTAYTGFLDIGRRFADSGLNTTGVLDLTAAGNVLIDASRIYLGTNAFTGPGQGQTSGVLRLPTGAGTGATLVAPSIWISHGDPVGNNGLTSEITLGPSTQISADELAVGRFKGKGVLRFATGVTGGTLTLGGRGGPGANLRVAYNAVDTATITDGTVNLTGGTLNATLAEFAVGVHNAGSGGARGAFIMDAGTVTADTLVLARPDNAGSSSVDTNTTALVEMNGGLLAVNGAVTDGNGTSTLLVDAGTMNVGDALKVDILRVGHNNVTGRSVAGVLKVNGAVVAGTASQALTLGRSETPNVAPIETIVGTADFTDAPSVTLLASELRLGTISADGNTSARGVLRLPTAGTAFISTPLISAGNSGFAGNTSGASEIHFGGATNTVQVDNFHLGRQKSNGLADIVAGGTLVLGGRAGAEANLFVGNNDNNSTGVQSTGVLNLTAGTLSATLNQLVIGRHGGGAGSGRGTFRMGAGTVGARAVTLGDPSANGTSSAPANTTGFLELDGGVFTVDGSVLDGGGGSRLDVLSGLFSLRGNLDLDTVNLGQAAGADATLAVSPVDRGGFRRLTALSVGATGILRTGLLGDGSLLTVTNVTFAAGSRIDADAAIAAPVTSLLTADASTWTAGTNTWDDVTHAHWDRGLPSGLRIATGATQTVLRALGTVTDGGLVPASTNWTVAVTSGPGGRVDLVRAGPALVSGQVPAEILAATAVVTRPGDLRIGDLPGSGADASALVMNAGSLTVAGAVGDDGGTSAVLVNGGSLQAAGGLDTDTLRAGYNGRTGQVSAGGAIRIGTGSEILDIGRRDNGDATTVGSADFSAATGLDIQASEIRVGSNVSGANTSVRGSLLLPAAGNSAIGAATISVGDSTAAASLVLSEVVAGTGTTTVNADAIYLGRRKSYGRLTAGNGATVSIAGRTGAAASLFLGHNDVGTATESRGTLDLSNATLFATLGQVVLGLHGAPSGTNTNGSGRGTFIMGAGSVSAVSVVLADPSAQGVTVTPALTTGTLDLRGGAFGVTQNIADGGGVSQLLVSGAAVSAQDIVDVDFLTLSGGALTADEIRRTGGGMGFAFTGGTLSARVLSVVATNLVQAGGVLAPAAAGGRTTVTGGYDLASGAWRLEHGGFTNGAVAVQGDLLLGAGSTLDLALTGDAYEEAYVLATYGSLSGAFAVTNNLPAGWTIDYQHLGQPRIALVPRPGVVSGLTVTIENGRVVVRWTTGDETGVTGFHVERLDGSPAWQRLTASPVPALGGSGNAYAYTDATATPGAVLRYRILVLTSGGEVVNGPFVRPATQEVRVREPVLGAPGSATLTWASNEGSTYAVLRSPSLAAPAWTPVATGVAATPPLNVFTDTNAAGDRFYYRIEIE